MNINELNRIKTINVENALRDVELGSGTFKNLLNKVYDETIIPLVNNEGTIIGINYDAKCNNIIEDNIAETRFMKAYLGKDIMRWILKCLEIKANGNVKPVVIETKDYVKVILDNGQEELIEDYTLEDEYDEEDYDDYDEDEDEYDEEYEDENDTEYRSVNLLVINNKEVKNYFINLRKSATENALCCMLPDLKENDFENKGYIAYILDGDLVDSASKLEFPICNLRYDFRKPDPKTYTRKDLPEVEEILVDDIDGEINYNSVKDYLRKKYGYYISRDSKLSIEPYANTVIVNGIKWGRKID